MGVVPLKVSFFELTVFIYVLSILHEVNINLKQYMLVCVLNVFLMYSSMLSPQRAMRPTQHLHRSLLATINRASFHLKSLAP